MDNRCLTTCVTASPQRLSVSAISGAGSDAASETLADAVIEALALKVEHDSPPRPGDRSRWEPRHRYVTEWTTDE